MKEKIPSLGLLQKNYPKLAELNRDALFALLGWESLLATDEGRETWQNTCAIRMSLCLIRCGMVLTSGGMRIQRGEHKGKRIEPSRQKLASYLRQKSVWGEPTFEATSSAKMHAAIGISGGVISFGPLPGYSGGHIDIIDGFANIFNSLFIYGGDGHAENRYECGSHCYWDARDFWFWKADW